MKKLKKFTGCLGLVALTLPVGVFFTRTIADNIKFSDYSENSPTTSLQGNTEQIALGQNHSLALTTGGEVYSWGQNNYGQLGDGTREDSSTPINITSQFLLSEGDEIVYVDAGLNHSAALTADGQVYMWGSNIMGQLAIGYEGTEKGNAKTNECALGLPTAEEIAEILEEIIGDPPGPISWEDFITTYLSEAVARYECVITDNAHLSTPQNVTETIIGEHSPEYEILSIELGGNSSAAILEKTDVDNDPSNDYHILRTFGENTSGQLAASAGVLPLLTSTSYPHSIRAFGSVLPNDFKIISFSSGRSYSIALMEINVRNGTDTKVFVWGNNFYNQLTSGNRQQPKNLVPFELFKGEISKIEDIEKVYAGYSHSAALTKDGSLYMWGESKHGELALQGDNNGADNTVSQPKNTSSALPDGTIISDVALGKNYSIVLDSNGNVLTWGYNAQGQLGNGKTISEETYYDITSNFNGETISDVETGYNHAAAITEDGNIYTWGYNGQGQLGTGDNENQVAPTDIFTYVPIEQPKEDLGTDEILVIVLSIVILTGVLTSMSIFFYKKSKLK